MSPVYDCIVSASSEYIGSFVVVDYVCVCVSEAVHVSGFMAGWLGSCAAECVCLPCLSALMRLPVPVACKLCLAECSCEYLWK
jgi:hypothetical protein